MSKDKRVDDIINRLKLKRVKCEGNEAWVKLSKLKEAIELSLNYADRNINEESKFLSDENWILCLVSKINTVHEHEIIHPIGTRYQDYCPVCMEKKNKEQ